MGLEEADEPLREVQLVRALGQAGRVLLYQTPDPNYPYESSLRSVRIDAPQDHRT